jgi:hypothetical protein
LRTSIAASRTDGLLSESLRVCPIRGSSFVE